MCLGEVQYKKTFKLKNLKENYPFCRKYVFKNTNMYERWHLKWYWNKHQNPKGNGQTLSQSPICTQMLQYHKYRDCISCSKPICVESLFWVPSHRFHYGSR